MICEMCGKDVELTTRVRVEGTVLNLCPACAAFGEAVTPPPAPAVPRASGGPRSPYVQTRPMMSPRARTGEERDVFTEMPERELAADWAKRIRVAREHLNWTPEELGKRLNEKKSVVLKIESGNFHPSDGMVRKIEHLLHIRLRADPEKPSSP
jgi:putative transcription factor